MRILLVSYHFPPDAEIGGVRPYQLARHLPACGVEPWILTVRPEHAETLDDLEKTSVEPELRVVRSWIERTHRDLVLSLWRRLSPGSGLGNGRPAAALPPPVDQEASPRRFSAVREWILSWLAFPDLRIGWYRPAVREGGRLIAQGGIDVVISSSPPIVAHLVAGRLARTHRIPWIMDFRDPWFTDGYERPASRLMRHLQGRLLRRSASRAAAIVGNTPALCRSLAGRLGATGPRTVCIRNGAFALDAVAEAPEYPSEFRIAHVGNLVGHRTAAAFLRGLRRWMDRERDHGQARVRFVGSGFVSDHRVLDDLGLRDVVTVSPRVPRREALELMAEQWVLLLLANDQPLQVPGKAYEYLATGRRILAVTEREGSTAEVLGGEPGCQVAEDEAEVAKALDRFFREYRERAPGRFDRGPFLASNSYAARAAVYADLIRSVAASGDAETRGAIGGD